jgi:hypothetical protein
MSWHNVAATKPSRSFVFFGKLSFEKISFNSLSDLTVGKVQQSTFWLVRAARWKQTKRECRDGFRVRTLDS